MRLSGHEMSVKPFGAVVGNPPYQAGQVQDPLLIGKSPINVFHHFQKIYSNVSDRTSLVYPGGRWASRTGRGMDEFGGWLSNSRALQEVVYWARSFDLFGKDVEVSGGVTAVYTDSTIDNGGQWGLTEFHEGSTSSGMVNAPGDRSVSLFPVLNGIESAVLKVSPSFVSLNSRKLSFSVFGLASSFAVDNPELVVRCSESFDNVPVDDGSWLRVMVNDAAGKGGRAAWFWTRRENLSARALSFADSWKVVMSAKNINGLNGRSTQVEVMPPGTAHSSVRVCIGVFATEVESVNFFRWLRTDFVRCLIAASGSLVGSFACKVPDLGDYSSDNDIIDFSSPDTLNEQLFNFYKADKSLIDGARVFAESLSGFSNFDY